VMRFHGAYKIFEFSTIIGNTESRFIITLYVERSSKRHSFSCIRKDQTESFVFGDNRAY